MWKVYVQVERMCFMFVLLGADKVSLVLLFQAKTECFPILTFSHLFLLIVHCLHVMAGRSTRES